MKVEKQFPSGAWIVSGMIGGFLFTRTYFGYSKREAVAEFKRDTKKPRKVLS